MSCKKLTPGDPFWGPQGLRKTREGFCSARESILGGEGDWRLTQPQAN